MASQQMRSVAPMASKCAIGGGGGFGVGGGGIRLQDAAAYGNLLANGMAGGVGSGRGGSGGGGGFRSSSLTLGMGGRGGGSSACVLRCEHAVFDGDVPLIKFEDTRRCRRCRGGLAEAMMR